MSRTTASSSPTARNKRDGRSIETIGEYHPKSDPSIIKVDGRPCRLLGSASARSRPRPSPRSSRSPATGRSSRGLPEPPPMLMAPEKPDKARAVRSPRPWPRSPAARTTPLPPARPPRAASGPPRPPHRRRTSPPADAPPPAADAPATRRTRHRCTGDGRLADAPRRATHPRAADVLEDALEHLVKGIVDPPGRPSASTWSTTRRGSAVGDPRAPRGSRPGHRPAAAAPPRALRAGHEAASVPRGIPRRRGRRRPALIPGS